MNKCFKCGTEFEGKFCPKCGERAIRVLPKGSYILKYLPAVMFALWAVLLWAFYAAKLTAAELFDDFSVNLYQALKDDTFENLFPVLNALLSFAVISNVYMVVLGLIAWKGNATHRVLANIVGILLQLAVFICAIVTGVKVIIELGLENGSFMVTVVAISSSLIHIELICTILYYCIFDRQRGRKYTVLCENCGHIQDEILTIYENAERVNLSIVSQFNFIKDVVVEGGQKFKAVNGCVIELKTKTLVYGCQNSTIPNDGSVRAIGEFAFYKCKHLNEIVIPETVNYIGWGSFRLCKRLKQIKYKGSKAQWKKIFKEPYWYCAAIKRVVCKDGTIIL